MKLNLVRQYKFSETRDDIKNLRNLTIRNSTLLKQSMLKQGEFRFYITEEIDNVLKSLKKCEI